MSQGPWSQSRSEPGEGAAPEAPGSQTAGAGAEAQLAALRPGFALEVQQVCARVTQDLLALEEPALEPAVAQARRQRVQRALHGLRGSAATLGAEELAVLAAELEGRMGALALPLPRTAADALMYGLEQLVRRAQGWAGAPAAQAPAAASEPGGPRALPSQAAQLAARLGELQARLGAGAAALSRAAERLARGEVAGAALTAEVAEGARALGEGSAQAGALAAALSGEGEKAP